MSKLKIWQKEDLSSTDITQKVEKFTVGNDTIVDMHLASHDVVGSLAHIEMLEKVGLLKKEELSVLQKELIQIYADIENKNFQIREGAEDIHTEVELRLTEKLGDVGKKIHSGRSRNDQVLTDLKLFTRAELERTIHNTHELFSLLIELSNRYKDKYLPGYTHLQIAMISSFGLWLSAYAESLVDDMNQLKAAFIMANKNPLGSGAGYGGSLPLDRQITTDLLGFKNLNVNAIYAQMNRGKMERNVSSAIGSLASTLSKLAMDVCLYSNQDFGFITLPDAFTTGSSIMPHKKNPDIFELIRAKCNKISALPYQISLITTNLPSGYHRDMQMIKEDFVYMFGEINACIEMAILALKDIKVKENILDNPKYLYLFSVETVNQYVQQGVPFRDAYIKVGQEIASGGYQKPELVNHTHIGSVGNLSLDRIESMMSEVYKSFDFSYNTVVNNLLKK